MTVVGIQLYTKTFFVNTEAVIDIGIYRAHAGGPRQSPETTGTMLVQNQDGFYTGYFAKPVQVATNEDIWISQLDSNRVRASGLDSGVASTGTTYGGAPGASRRGLPRRSSRTRAITFSAKGRAPPARVCPTWRTAACRDSTSRSGSSCTMPRLARRPCCSESPTRTSTWRSSVPLDAGCFRRSTSFSRPASGQRVVVVQPAPPELADSERHHVLQPVLHLRADRQQHGF